MPDTTGGSGGRRRCGRGHRRSLTRRRTATRQPPRPRPTSLPRSTPSPKYQVRSEHDTG